ncbi:phytanoyl-CoA dioxygenase family protein [Streptomyces sp. ISL-43]|uniref:phytanoyl-CoA dioxygenase family protein n=1 Tax=Streptomyces sp. ISL-43 TaxID=2819183 RepID=UPI001BE844AB|nr:phytanoyl-CoA dioxygenase family protein [Streptomyces sp. ISL-43]MBT2453096.1 phytanoyl-CoA dioxygenase family protein [Streptomyces sp. ISL-43]
MNNTAAFERDGYLVADIFSDNEVAEMKKMLSGLIDTPVSKHPRLHINAASDKPLPQLDPYNPYAVWKIVNTPLAGDDWYALIHDDRILDVVGELLGPDINFHMGFARLRPTGLKAEEGWHRDLDTDQHTRPELVTALIYLDDMDAEAGTTLIWPGSHRHREPEPEHHEVVPIQTRPGAVLFLHCLTVHRASTNMTARHRSILIHEYKSAQTVELTPNDAAFGDLPMRRGGRNLSLL